MSIATYKYTYCNFGIFVQRKKIQNCYSLHFHPKEVPASQIGRITFQVYFCNKSSITKIVQKGKNDISYLFSALFFRERKYYKT